MPSRLPQCKQSGKLGAVCLVFGKLLVSRLVLRVLPLPLCIAMAMTAEARDRPQNWALCPLVDAVPAFGETGPQLSSDERAQLQTDIDGDAITGTEGESTTFSGDVTLRRGDQLLHTDNLTFDQETGKYLATGSVRYQDSSMRLMADELEGDQDDDSHVLRNVRYQLVDRRGSGGAEHVEMQGEQGTLYHSTYSTCPPNERMWELRAQRIDVDNAEGMGVARNAQLRIGKVPVLYVPVMYFPTDERRRSGLLMPNVRISGRNGLDWNQPIYFNLAPNYDYTFSPRLMSKRGLMLGNQFRYLVPQGQGVLEVDYLHNDKLSRDGRDEELALGIPSENWRASNRGRVSFVGRQGINRNWQARANLNWISDPRYIEDMANAMDGLADYALSSNAGVYGRGRHWSAGIDGRHWQLADFRLRERQLQYGHLPRAYFSWQQPLGNLLQVGLDSEAVRFVHTDSDARPGGMRLDVKPSISAPLAGDAWFLTPTLAWRHTSYRLDQSLADRLGGDATPSRSTPIASLDAGLFFERETSVRGRAYTHTLEPRLFYLNVPYREQSHLPLFDTRPLTFGWGQLFRDNRYTGPDRQTDANQMTVAVSSRLIRQTDGREKLSANLGQIVYFDDSRVVVPGETPVEKGRSAWVMDGNYLFNDRWSLGAGYQWDPKYRRRDLVSVRTRYLVGDTGVVNLNYRNRRDLLEQVDLSFLYPINPNWSVVGRYYYDLKDNQLLEGIAGVQWENCCMAMRVVGRRYLRNRSSELNNAIQMEFELKGLGSAGPDTSDRLRRAILGYYREDLYLVPPNTGDRDILPPE